MSALSLLIIWHCEEVKKLAITIRGSMVTGELNVYVASTGHRPA